MANNLIYTLEVFIFIFCCLNILKNAYNLIKVLGLKDGKISSDILSVVYLGLSISYVLTSIIIGF